MNETLKPYLEKLLSSGAKTVEEAAKFIETQTPELASEIIRWGAVSEIVAPIIGLALLIFSIIFHFKCRKNEDGYYAGYGNGDFPPGLLFTSIGFIAGSVMFFSQVMDVIYPLVAPRLYILEKISSLIK